MEHDEITGITAERGGLRGGKGACEKGAGAVHAGREIQVLCISDAHPAEQGSGGPGGADLRKVRTEPRTSAQREKRRRTENEAFRD